MAMAVSAESGAPPKVLVFHSTSRRFTYSSTNYSPQRLTSLLSGLIASGLLLSDLKDLVDNPRPGRVALTFDDGFRSLLEIVPRLLDEFDCRPTVFVPTAYIGRPNSWDYGHRLAPQDHLDAPSLLQLAELGVHIAAHGHRHIDLTRLPLDQASTELGESRHILEKLLGCDVDTVSYPFGRVNPEIIEAAGQAGYRHGFTLSYPSAADDPLARGRMAVYGFDTPLAVRQKLSGGWGRRLEAFKAGLTNRLSHGTTLLNRVRQGLSSTG